MSVSLEQAVGPGKFTVIARGAIHSICLLALMFAGAYVIRMTFRRRHVAPGPPRLPIMGNVLQLPQKLQFIRLTEWAQKYGWYRRMPRYSKG